MTVAHNRNPAAAGTASGARETVKRAADGPESTKSLPEKATRYAPQKAWHRRNPWAGWSHAALRSAERRGLIVRPGRCEACGEEKPVDAHHADHRRPLDVKWWCRGCHRRHHAAERKVR